MLKEATSRLLMFTRGPRAPRMQNVTYHAEQLWPMSDIVSFSKDVHVKPNVLLEYELLYSGSVHSRDRIRTEHTAGNPNVNVGIDHTVQ